MEVPDDSFDLELANVCVPTAGITSDLQLPQQIAPASEGSSRENQPAPAKENNLEKFTIEKSSSSNYILVNPLQRKNPLLKSITTVPYEFQNIVPDYVVGSKACVLFLSLSYHLLNKEYIEKRIEQLGKMYELRILLVQVDIKDPFNVIKSLTRICLLCDLTLMLAWNAHEAGKIVETYKRFEHKSPELIMERGDENPKQQVIAVLTSIKPINKTDAALILDMFGNMKQIAKVSKQRLAQCAGLGPIKANKLRSIFEAPFIISAKDSINIPNA